MCPLGQSVPLGLHQRLNTGFRKIQQSIQLWTAERFPFCRTLDLQQAPVTRVEMVTAPAASVRAAIEADTTVGLRLL